MFVPIRGYMLAADALWPVSGDHTRTIQIATPTVGGLMKFAVKTVTCLGCKTPLRANNSVKSRCPPDLLDFLFIYAVYD